jgi:uncharacterized membrane protein YoaT (DUF817 family)
MHRYDFIFLAALAFQLFLLAFRIETLREALVIVVFHRVDRVMEVVKTSDAIATYVNLWIYPNQMQDWSPVSLAKFPFWYLLMLLSFVLTTINRVELPQGGAGTPCK